MLSFDDGPAPISTPYILDQLHGIKNCAGNPVRAAFFLIGKDKSGSRPFDIWSCEKKIHLPFGSRLRDDMCPDPGVVGNSEIVRAIENAGHYVFVHGEHHADLSRLSTAGVESEVLGCYQDLLEAGARPLKFFRPPYLSNPAIASNSILVKENWRIISGTPSGDGSPFATEGSLTESCKKSIERAVAYPVVLIFHDFRGRPGRRLNFRKIVTALIDSNYELEDFDPEKVSKPVGETPSH